VVAEARSGVGEGAAERNLGRIVRSPDEFSARARCHSRSPGAAFHGDLVELQDGNGLRGEEQGQFPAGKICLGVALQGC
jgi:hypothetical protein